ncbi:MAG: hypothetical protein C0475_06725 [Planctomyces sp.]|nr:hypothetical protein [Planctomyces sp.]MBA4039882.1 hypothetical protein [Planctomyces sp.]
MQHSLRRDYRPLLDRLAPRPGESRHQAMSRLCDALWDAFASQGLSWVGFYLPDPADPSALLLGPRRDKPACSPIGLHGVCGRGLTTRRAVVVRDVAVMGPSYIACDPRDRSELVAPCFNPDGSCWGVIDLDSFDLGAFDQADALSVLRLARHTGLSAHQDDAAVGIDLL